MTPRLADPVLDGSVKGWPDLGCRASEVAERDLSIDDLGTPVLAIRAASLEHNIAVFAQWCARAGVELAPHAKTTMAPCVLERQLAAGAWGLTVANVRQARIALACGARRIVIANELTVADDLAWVCERNAEGAAEVIFCVDSPTGLALAETAHARRGGPPLPVLVEIGYEGGRCGLRTSHAVADLAQAVARSPHVALRGIEGFEGLIADPDPFLHSVLAGVAAVAPLVEGPDPILTAGGSAYFDRVVDLLGPAATDHGWTLCLRSGCYVTHDHGLYADAAAHRSASDAPRFEPAIDVRASVLSHPQPDRLILDCGRRDVSFDAGLPVVLDDGGVASAELLVVALNDQHAHVEVGASCPVGVGDVLRLGISHPCTALDRWRVIPLVDDAGRVVEAAATCF